MSRRPDWIKRGPRLTKKERAAMLEAQGGVCAICAGPGPFDADHTWAVTDGNKGKPDRLICKPCHAPKSAEEKARAEKADRQGMRSGRQKRSRDAKANGRRVWPSRKINSNPTIPSRPFERRSKND